VPDALHPLADTACSKDSLNTVVFAA